VEDDQLLDAVEDGDLELARALLLDGASPHEDSWGLPLIDQALERLDVEMARLLMEFGGRHRLHQAASGDAAARVRVLLDLGLDPRVRRVAVACCRSAPIPTRARVQARHPRTWRASTATRGHPVR
jgi:hypothetical protein